MLKHEFQNKASKICVGILFAFFLCFFLKYSEITAAGVKNGIVLCIRALIPALFPFLVLSSFAVSSGICTRFGRMFVRKGGRLSDAGWGAYLIGLVAGFPTGAVTVFDLWEAGKLDTDTAKWLCAVTNNTGPAFLIGFVGAFLWKDPHFGVVLFFCQMLAGICLILTKPKPKLWDTALRVFPQEKNQKNIIVQMTSAVKRATWSMALICGFVLFFSVLREMLFYCLSFITGLDSPFPALLSGLLEISTGTADATTLPLGKVFTAFIIGWSGLCVHFQVMAFVPKDFPMRTYFREKFLSGILCALFCFGWQFITQHNITLSRMIFLLLGAVLLLFLLVLMRHRAEKAKCLPAHRS